MTLDLGGTYAAVVTPFDEAGTPSTEQFERCLNHLAQRGSHGVLIAGTTGEGASLSVAERKALFQAAGNRPHGLRILAGTGAASLEDTVQLTRAAYDSGCDATVVIPPFFYKSASDDGLLSYFKEVLNRSVPKDGKVLLYHNPVTAAIGLSLDLVKRLHDSFPNQIVGIKDSSQNWEHTLALISALPEFVVLVGNDRLLGKSLANGGAGSITLVSNVFPDLAGEVYRLHKVDKTTDKAQERLNNAHEQFSELPRIAAVKTLLKSGGIITNDAVRPPLTPLTEIEKATLNERFLLDVEIPKTIKLSDLFDAANS